MYKHYLSLVACARWENEYIAEWLNYHRSIGVDHIYLYCNDDQPDGLYAQVLPYLAGPDPFVTFIYYPFVGHQRYMYRHFLRHFLRENAWIGFIDIDEFIQIMDSSPLPQFIGRFDEQWDAISINWLFFGTCGFKERPPGSVLLQYRRRAEAPHPFTKVLTRTSAVTDEWLEAGAAGDFWHHWRGLPAMRQCNVAGEEMNGYYDEFPKQAFKLINDHGGGGRLIRIARISHFAFKSEGDFLLRAQRGTAGDFSAQAIWKDLHDSGGVENFVEHLNAVEDESLATYWSAQLNKGLLHSVVSRPPFANIALGRPARQSSLSEWSTGPDDAQGAVSGNFTGSYQFHTNFEFSPWWEVDLPGRFVIRQIGIYNRMEFSSRRPVRLQIECWIPETGFRTVYRMDAPRAVGGVDGNPFIWLPAQMTRAERVRITALGNCALHLDQVEIFGYAA